jgi:transposase
MPSRDAPLPVESDGSRQRGRAELLRVIELDPHEVGQDTANWTTERLAEYLGQQTGIQVTEETVRVYLHAHDYVCKRPTWTLRRKAEEKADYVGNG